MKKTNNIQTVVITSIITAILVAGGSVFAGLRAGVPIPEGESPIVFTPKKTVEITQAPKEETEKEKEEVGIPDAGVTMQAELTFEQRLTALEARVDKLENK